MTRQLANMEITSHHDLFLLLNVKNRYEFKTPKFAHYAAKTLH